MCLNITCDQTRSVTRSMTSKSLPGFLLIKDDRILNVRSTLSTHYVFFHFIFLSTDDTSFVFVLYTISYSPSSSTLKFLFTFLWE